MTHAENSSDTKAGGVFAAIAGGLIILGSFLPWATVQSGFGSFSRSGMDGGDGIFTVALGILTLVIGIARVAAFAVPSFLQRSTIVTGILTGVGVIYEHVDISDRISRISEDTEGIATASIGSGIWTLYVGAVLAIVAGFILRGSKSTPARQASEVDDKDTKTCPQCAERVKAAARVCRFCGHQFATVGAAATGSPPPPPASPT